MPDFAGGAERSHPPKIALRNQLLAARRSLTPETRAKSTAAVQAALQDLVRAQRPTIVAGYVPLGPEPGGPDLPDVLTPLPLLLPVLLPDNDVDWVRYQGPGSLRRGRLGLREPDGPRLGVDAVREAELVIVPALAVDRSGLRLGRGGGSYDRVLARATGYSVALLHDGELLPTVPGEPHDRRVHATITPAEGLSDTADWTK